MLHPRLTRLQAKEFRSLADVDIPLNPLTVLVGPNGSGKTNVLNALRFLASTVRFDLAGAIEEWDGFRSIKRRGDNKTRDVTIRVKGLLTKHASKTALDEYELRFSRDSSGDLTRHESFTFKGTPGRGRRRKIENNGSHAAIGSENALHLATDQTTALVHAAATRRRPRRAGIRKLADFLSSIRILEPDVAAARRPSRLAHTRLADDAGNLSSVLHHMSRTDPESFESLVSEMRFCLPGLDSIGFQPVRGPGRKVAVTLREVGLRSPIHLQDASSGTVRALALLTALHEPDPPPFTGVDGVDRSLHPWVSDILVDRLRAASRNSQIIITTHSPTLVNRLDPSELIVCDRDPETGASVIPCISSWDVMRAKRSADDLRLGELWFAGDMGGVPREAS